MLRMLPRRRRYRRGYERPHRRCEQSGYQPMSLFRSECVTSSRRLMVLLMRRRVSSSRRASLTSPANTLNASRSIAERDRWHDRCPCFGFKKGVETNVPCNLDPASLGFRRQF